MKEETPEVQYNLALIINYLNRSALSNQSWLLVACKRISNRKWVKSDRIRLMKKEQPLLDKLLTVFVVRIEACKSQE